MNFRADGALGRRREEARIDLTPLIDVVFLLLIFFLITTTFVKEKNPNLPIEVPEASSAVPTPEDQDLTVHLTKDGSVYIDDVEQLDDSMLEDAFTRLAGHSKRAIVLIRADTETHHGRVVRVMDLARRAGLRRFGIVSRKR